MKNIESGKTRCLKNIKAINNTGMVNEIIQVNILPKYPFLLSISIIQNIQKINSDYNNFCRFLQRSTKIADHNLTCKSF